MVTFFDSIEYAMLRAGWRNGVEALVTSWVEYRRARIKWEETWQPDGRHRYFHETASGIRFVIEWLARDKWALGVSWPDEWGHEHISTGPLDALQEEANQLAKVGGPFGGPPKPSRPICAISPGRVWRAAGEVELRFEVMRENLGVHFHTTRAGILNDHRVFNFDQSKLQEQVDSFTKIEPSGAQQWVLVEGKRRPWSHTAMRPLIAHMNLGERELLLVRPDPPSAVVLAHKDGRLQTALTIDSLYLSDFDITWLDDAPRWPDQQGAWGHVEVIAGSAPLRPYNGPPGQNPSKPPRRVAEAAPSPTRLGEAGSTPRSLSPADIASTKPAATRSSPQAAEQAQGPDSAGRTPQSSAPPVPAAVVEARDGVAVSSAEAAPPSSGPPLPASPSTNTPSRAAMTATASAAEAPATGLSSPPPIAVEEIDAPVGTASQPTPQPPTSPAPSAEPPGPSPPVDSPPPPQSTSLAAEGAPPEPDQPKPRFPLAENPSSAEIERHFAEIEASIPPKLTGAATAVEIWQALGHAHRHGALPITGGWIDLVSVLHRRGWLSRLPGDRATRAAFLILENLSPLVRRLHRRRWVLGLER
jgi:hypothetical protein